MQVVIPVGITYDQMREDFRAIVRYELTNAPAVSVGPPTVLADELLSIREAATLLGVTVQTIHEWKRVGRLCFYKLASRSYLKRADVLAALTPQQRTVKSGRGGACG